MRLTASFQPAIFRWRTVSVIVGLKRRSRAQDFAKAGRVGPQTGAGRGKPGCAQGRGLQDLGTVNRCMQNVCKPLHGPV